MKWVENNDGKIMLAVFLLGFGIITFIVALCLPAGAN
jgi:hypothetical protein